MNSNNNTIPFRAVSRLQPGRTLVFAPHPDDEIFGCGGAILRHVQQGDEVKVVIVTDGGYAAHPHQQHPAYVSQRWAESVGVSKMLGYPEPIFLNYRDRSLVAGETLIRHFFQILLEFAPQYVFLPAASEIHPDHQAVHSSGIQAIERYHEIVQVFLYEVGIPLQPNLLLDITDIQPLLEKAMQQFISQQEVQDYSRHISALHAYRTYTLPGNIQYAEAYDVFTSKKLSTGDAWWEKIPKTDAGSATKSPKHEVPLVSVIVRTMNRPELSDALNSIARQDFPEVEVIVVSGSGQALKLGPSCGPFPIHQVVPSGPLGRPQACNAGLEAVRGDYFCFLDEDDLLLPEAISELVRTINSSTAMAAYGAIERVNSRMEHEMNYAHPFSFAKLFWENYIPNLAVLYRSQLIESGCRFDETLELFEDWDFLLQVCEKGDFVFRDVKTGIYRNFNTSGIQNETGETLKYKRKVIEKWIQRIPMARWIETMQDNSTELWQAGSEFFAQLFYRGSTELFCEENSKRLSVRFKKGKLDFVLEKAVKVSAIRFDPLTYPVHIQLSGITLMHQGKTVDIPLQLHSNACYNSDFGEIFETSDPQVYFEAHPEHEFWFDRAIVELEYVCTGIQVIEKIARHRLSLIKELQASVAEKDHRMSVQESLISEFSDSLNLAQRKLSDWENKGRMYQSEIEESQRLLDEYRTHLQKILQSLEYIWSVRVLRILRFLYPANMGDTIRNSFRRRKLARLIKGSSLFDTHYYLIHNPDVASRGMVPEWHYLLYGGVEGRDPSPVFSSGFYLKQYPDVKDSGMNPLVHYLLYGQKEGRKSLPPEDFVLPYHEIQYNYESKHLSSESGHFLKLYEQALENAGYARSSEYEPENVLEGDLNPSVKLIAFYLPQFHPIPENDKWWGKGFTEWTNVTKAIPQFLGHYQPKLPGDLGFYDLRIPEVIHQQVTLARKYGIHGFCFHYYWFSGRRLLEKPLRMFIESKTDFPFCICWANENWTRRWDGSDDEILISQPHHFENDKDFINDILPLLNDVRYVKINGRPIIIIYRPGLLEEPEKILNYWRETCKGNGVENPFIIGAQTFGFQDPTPLGFDAAIEFPPHNEFYTKVNDRFEILNKSYSGSIYDYREMIQRSLGKPVPNYLLFRTLAPSWDNDARKPGNGHSFADSGPALYNIWLEGLCRQVLKNADSEPMVFVNAWNEWAEGAYLEPDRRYGYANLIATYKAIKSASSIFLMDRSGQRLRTLRKRSSNAIILHVFYWEIFAEMAASVRQLPEPADVYVSVPEIHSGHISEVFEVFPEAAVMVVENRGRDIAPFLAIFREIADWGYERILKLHTKKSSHREDGGQWREDILSKLVQSPDAVRTIAEVFKQSPGLGIVGPSGHVVHKSFYWGSNKDLTLRLANQVGIQADERTGFHFVAGSMFWFRPEALKSIVRLPVNFYDFPEEPIPTDGTLAHAIERLMGLCVVTGGFEIWQVDRNGRFSLPRSREDYDYAEPIHEI